MSLPLFSLGTPTDFVRFELFSGSQLHIDMDDSWTNISHYRVIFKPYDVMIKDPTSEAIIKSWPKPLSIEWLEAEYDRWCEDLTSLCWQATEVRELGSGAQSDSAVPAVN
jgi:hypothetical protein